MQKLAWILTTIGALNWGLIGIGAIMTTNLNIVNLLLGNYPMIEVSVYILVGIAALIRIPSWKSIE
ncbi:MAG: DUF378 domain-containing protein [bacterium]